MSGIVSSGHPLCRGSEADSLNESELSNPIGIGKSNQCSLTDVSPVFHQLILPSKRLTFDGSFQMGVNSR